MWASVTVNVWVGRGTHWLFNCLEGDLEGQAAEGVSNACDHELMQFRYPQTNNVILNVKALDCQLQKSYFRKLSAFGTPDLFTANCVQVGKGAKPEIRLQSKHTYFNITRSALFENLDFTGADLLATPAGSVPCPHLEVTPVTKCEITNPSPMWQEPSISKTAAFTCGYECVIPGFSTGTDGSCTYSHELCEGTLGHPGYFMEDSSGQFPFRHTSFINLYAFDPMHSETPR